MDAAQRLALIRARAKTTASHGSYSPIGLFGASHPGVTQPRHKQGYVRRPPGPPRSFNKQAAFDLANAHRPEWVSVPKKRKKIGCSIKRTKKISPLTKIAEAWEDQETFAPTPISCREDRTG